MSLCSTVFRAVCLALSLCPQVLLAQLYSAQRDADDVTYQGCDSSQVVNFTDSILGSLTYGFNEAVIAGSTTTLNTVWTVYDGSVVQAFGPSYDHTFPSPGEHLVCLTVNAFDLVAQRSCSTTVCRLQYMYQEESCQGLMPNFTIGAVAGQSITFQDESAFNTSLSTAQWSFGEDAQATGTSVTHTFAGTGPYEVCLTLTENGPDSCTATVCKWLYLGPVPVECDSLLRPGFIMVQQMDLVGALDTSITSGMEHSISWDHGDDSPLQLGRYTVHAYADAGTYELCNTIRIWGPLVTDTCSRTLCRTVFTMAVGLNEATDPQQDLEAYPVPSAQEVLLAGLEPGLATLEVFANNGSRVLERVVVVGGLVALDLGSLQPGIYTVRCTQAMGTKVVRIVKQ